jgi:uncharacterized protein
METTRVFNTTKGTIIADQAEMATTFGTRLRGLLGRRWLRAGQGMVLQPTDSIHTFFMAFPIDVIFLDRSCRVLRVEPALPPNRLGPFLRHVHAVVELPVGALARTRTEPGDQLLIVE